VLALALLGVGRFTVFRILRVFPTEVVGARGSLFVRVGGKSFDVDGKSFDVGGEAFDSSGKAFDGGACISVVTMS
jgi:hypothetical protein